MTKTKRTSFLLEYPEEAGRVIRGRVEQPITGGLHPHVLVLHGFKGFMDWGFGPLLQRRIAQAGMASVAFNCSGSGIGENGADFTEEDAFARDTYSRQLEDIARVAEEVGQGRFAGVDPTRGALVGHSRGGGMGILHAARSRADSKEEPDSDHDRSASSASRRVPPVAALVTWAAIETADRYGEDAKAAMRRDGYLPIPNARTGQILRLNRDILDDLERNRAALDIEAACRRLTIPTLVIHGDADEAVDVRAADTIFTALASKSKRRWILAGAGHTFGASHPLGGEHPLLEGVIESTTRFLVEHLMPATGRKE